MNLATSIAIIVAAFIIGLAGAFQTNDKVSDPADLSATAEPENPPAPATKRFPHGTSADSGAHTHSDFTAVARGRAVLGSLESASPRDFPAMFHRARTDALEARLVAKRWAEIAPADFLDFLEKNPSGDPVGVDSREILFETWTANDSVAALAAASSVLTNKSESLKAVFAVLMNVDPDLGFQYIAENPNQRIPIDFSALDWTKSHPEQYARRLAGLPGNNNFRNLTLRYASEAWFDQDPAAALDFLAGLGDDPSNARPGALNNWSAKDPVAAAEYIANEVMGADRFIAANGVVSAWAKIDPQATMDWIEANLWGASRRNATERLLTEVADYDPQAVLGFLGEMPPTASRHDGYAALAKAWVKTDSDAALAWAHSLESPWEKKRIFTALADGWTNGGPWKDAGYYIAGHDDPTQIPSNFTAAIGKKWGSHFPYEALAWVKSLPPEHAGVGSKAVFDAWTSRNVGPVVNPLRGLPEGEIRSNAHSAVAANFFRKDFNKAAKWYQTLHYEDRQAALSGLSSDQRQRVESLAEE